MTPAYDELVSPRKWNLALLALALTVCGGAALAVALLLGVADPPRAPHLIYNAHNADDLAAAGETVDGIRLFALPADLQPPFTIEMEASNSGASGSAWGLWLRISDHYGSLSDYPVLIDNQGYVVSTIPNPRLEHRQFRPIQSGSNRLTVYFDADASSATFRINDEIVSRLFLPISAVEAGGLALYGDATLSWKSIKIYTG